MDRGLLNSSGSNFTSPLIVEHLGGADWRLWKLVESFDYHVGTYPSEDVITVPAGFITDFASIPRFLWAIYPPTGRWGKAAVVHDYLYRTGVRPRLECDAIFLEAMTVLGVPYARRMAMYWAVRLGGRGAYKGDDNA